MSGEKNLDTLLKTLEPRLNEGEIVFCTLRDLDPINGESFISIFKEEEGYTVILDKATADRKAIRYSFVAS